MTFFIQLHGLSDPSLWPFISFNFLTLDCNNGA